MDEKRGNEGHEQDRGGQELSPEAFQLCWVGGCFCSELFGLKAKVVPWDTDCVESWSLRIDQAEALVLQSKCCSWPSRGGAVPSQLHAPAELWRSPQIQQGSSSVSMDKPNQTQQC